MNTEKLTKQEVVSERSLLFSGWSQFNRRAKNCEFSITGYTILTGNLDAS